MGGGSKVTVIPLRAASSPPEDLLARCVAGEQGAWRDLHRQLHPTAASFLRRMGVATADLEDACQEVFVQVFRYLGRFERRADLKTWLYRICVSQAARSRRRATFRGALAWLRGDGPPPAEPARDADECVADVKRQVEQALGRMTARQRLVFVLYELEGLSGKEIAAIAGCPEPTVRGRLREARLLFRRAFEPERQPDSDGRIP